MREGMGQPGQRLLTTTEKSMGGDGKFIIFQRPQCAYAFQNLQ